MCLPDVLHKNMQSEKTVIKINKQIYSLFRWKSDKKISSPSDEIIHVFAWTQARSDDVSVYVKPVRHSLGCPNIIIYFFVIYFISFFFKFAFCCFSCLISKIVILHLLNFAVRK